MVIKKKVFNSHATNKCINLYHHKFIMQPSHKVPYHIIDVPSQHMFIIIRMYMMNITMRQKNVTKM